MTPFHIYLYGPGEGPIRSSFEAAQVRLETLERLYFEPDGSFVWSRDGGAQQVYGMLYDAVGLIQYGELRGHCERSTWSQLVEAIAGEAGQPLLVMRLPERELQNLQSFEAELWPSSR